MNRLLFASLCAALFTTAAFPVHASTLLGSQVTATVEYPTLRNVASYADTQTVGSFVEFPSGSLQLLPAYGGIYIVGVAMDVGASSIDLDYTQAASTLGAAFNGYVFTFGSSAPAITGASLDPASSFDPSQVGLTFAPNAVDINVAGLSVGVGSQILVDISFAGSAVPEPQAYVLTFVGLGLVAFVTWCKTRSTETPDTPASPQMH